MKKKVLIAAAAACIAGGGVALFAGNDSDPDILRSPGYPRCLSHPSANEGQCVSDGSNVFCELDMDVWAIIDCVKHN